MPNATTLSLFKTGGGRFDQGGGTTTTTMPAREMNGATVPTNSIVWLEIDTKRLLAPKHGLLLQLVLGLLALSIVLRLALPYLIAADPDWAMRLRPFEDRQALALLRVSNFAGLAFLQANPVAVVLCDYRMPRMNALELLQRLERDLPFYIVSGELDVGRLVAGNPRVAGVLTKPFPAEQMLALVRGHLPTAT